MLHCGHSRDGAGHGQLRRRLRQCRTPGPEADASMSTLLLSHPAALDHQTPPGHPERPDRIRAIERALEDERFAALVREQAPLGRPRRVAARPSGTPTSARSRRRRPREGLVAIDADTIMSPGTFEAALRGVGAAVQAVDEVMTGEGPRTPSSAMRPPGHHAERARAMGFCFFNNAAIAARHAQTAHGAERVAIVDWDVHHGNGTQDIFWSDADRALLLDPPDAALSRHRRRLGARRPRHHRQRAVARPATAATSSARRSRPRSCRALESLRARPASSFRPGSTPIGAIRWRTSTSPRRISPGRRRS